VTVIRRHSTGGAIRSRDGNAFADYVREDPEVVELHQLSACEADYW